VNIIEITSPKSTMSRLQQKYYGTEACAIGIQGLALWLRLLLWRAAGLGRYGPEAVGNDGLFS
jgi:hypothetical protein